MKKILILVAALLISTNAFAKKEQNFKFDMNELTCKELIESDEDTIAMMLMWIDGYLSGITGDTRFDSNQFTSFAGSLGEYCAKNQNSKVLDASHQLGVQK